jgi:predicted NBD/HSP70 family sugar kinase
MEKTTAAASSPQVLRRANARRVLEYAWRTGPFTASEAMDASGLTRSTVIGVCDDLVQQGWLDELGDARAAGAAGAYTKGRPARRYALRARAAVVVAVDAGAERITATVADLRGHVLGSASVEIPVKSPHRVERRADAEARRRLARSTVRDALAACDGGGAPVLAMTVGVPAPVDADGGSPADDWFWALMNPGYAELLADEAGIVTIENDANLVAIAERRSPLGSGRTVDSYIAMLAGEGLGSGLMIDRRLVRGRRGAAGEMRFLDHVEGVGSADGFALLARQWAVDAMREGLPSGSPLDQLDPRTLGEADVARAAAAGDPVAGGIIDRLAERLARICLVLGDLLDVDRVIVAGATVASLPAVIDRAAAILDASDDPTAPDLVASALGRDAVTVGAIEHALDLVRDRALDLVPAARDVA